jgi:hypothetical protein
MAYYTDETVTLETGSGKELELELNVAWNNAEPDVGIMGDWIDDWKITAINGSTRHVKWVDTIVSRSETLWRFIDEKIYDSM